MITKIKRLLFLFLLSIFFSSSVYVLYSKENNIKNNNNVIYFILQRGRGYKYPDIHSERINNIILKFAEAINYTSKENHNGYIWYKCRIENKYFYLPEAFIDEKKFSEYRLNSNGDIIIGTSRIDRLYSIPLNYIPSDLTPISNQIKAKGYEWRNLRLRKEAKKMFEQMINDASISGIHISILSAFRDSKYQSMLYTRAIKRKGLNERSVAKPGHSEHQLGTASDLTSDEIYYALSCSFEKTLAYKWLTENSWRYGIFLTYPRLKQRVTGYVYEPWHFRYWGIEHWNEIFSRYNIILR